MKTEEKKKNIEPEWLIEKRKLAKEAFEAEPLPNRVNHLWKYTDPTIFTPQSINIERISKIGMWQYSSPGVEVLHILDGVKKYESLIKEKFGSLIDYKNSKISLLNDSAWNSGYFIFIYKNRRLSEPISLTMAMEKLHCFYPIRNFIYLEDGADIKLIEQVCSQDQIYSDVNIITEIFLGNEAKLDLINLNMFGNKINYHLIQRASLASGAQLENTFISLGGNVTKIDLGVKLIDERAVARVSGVVLGDEIQRFDHHATIEHLAPYTKSALNFKVALKDKSRSAFTGNLKIAHEAVKSDAHQENRNILLSDEAKAESIPELEILTNDVVRCSHGVTVSHVDKEQIYYLMSRGLTQKEAEQVIVEGFMEPIVASIPDEGLRDEIMKKIKSKLEVL